jgi:hypothetical protein
LEHHVHGLFLQDACARDWRGAVIKQRCQDLCVLMSYDPSIAVKAAYDNTPGVVQSSPHLHC